MKTVKKYATTLVLAAACSAASGQEAPAPVQWTCWAEQGASHALSCRESTPGDPLQLVALRADALPPGYLTELFGPGGPAVTRLVRAKPETYSGRVWTIPLLSQPIDQALVAQLAKGVLCGRQPLCAVALASSATVLRADASSPVPRP